MQALDLYYVTMTIYDETFKNVHVIFTKDDLNQTLGAVLEQNHKNQIRIAETEKYPHVTFFFSGGREREFNNEKRILIPSPKVATYDLQPEMSAAKIAESICPELESGWPDFVCLNFANPDMVDSLIVADIAPKYYKVHHQTIINGLKAIPIDTVKTRAEADQILSEYVLEEDVRQFLLKNLSRKAEGGFSWKINLAVIEENLESIGQDIQFEGSFNGPTLFIRGARSNYVKDEDRDLIKQLFPKSTLVTMDTGHWVQAEKPQEFVEVVRNFLNAQSND